MTPTFMASTRIQKLANLSPTSVDVTNLGIAIEPPQDGSWSWTELATHHISHVPYGDGYIYAVDGLANYTIGTGQPEYTIGLFTDALAKGITITCSPRLHVRPSIADA